MWKGDFLIFRSLVVIASAIAVATLIGCGGGSSPPEQGDRRVTKTILDDQLTYPYGFFFVDHSQGDYKIFLGNTAGGLISRPIGDVWPCHYGLTNPQYGEVYSYDSANAYAKRHIKSYFGFVERGASFWRQDGSVDLVFVENRDGHIITMQADSGLSFIADGIRYDTQGARPYDVKIARLSGVQSDIVFSTYTTNELRLIRGDTGATEVLADGLAENRTVELYTFDGDAFPSIVTTAIGASAANEDPDQPTGWVSVLRNQGNYQFVDHRFSLRGAVYTKLVKIDTRAPNDLFLVVSHGLRDEVEPSAKHGIAIYKYDSVSNQIAPFAHYAVPYVYRFDFSDLNEDGILDIAAGGHDGSGKVFLLMSERKNQSFDFHASEIDSGMVAVNDVKFHAAKEGGVDLFVTADNGNGCPRKVGGSRLVKYHFQ